MHFQTLNKWTKKRKKSGIKIKVAFCWWKFYKKPKDINLPLEVQRLKIKETLVKGEVTSDWETHESLVQSVKFMCEFINLRGHIYGYWCYPALWRVN